MLRLGLLIGMVALLLGACSTKDRQNTAMEDLVPIDTQRLLRMRSFQDAVADFGSNDLMEHLEQPALLPFFENKELMDNLQSTGASLLCYQADSSGQAVYTFIGEGLPGIALDSLPRDSWRIKKRGEREVQEIELGGTTYFGFVEDSIQVLSTSEVILGGLMDRQEASRAQITSIAHLKKSSDISLYMPVDRIPLDDSAQVRLGSQSVMELKLYPEMTAANGMILHEDSLPALIDIFKGLQPQPETIAGVMPTEAEGFVRLAYDDVNLLETNLTSFQDRAVRIHPALDAISEMALARFDSGNALVLNSTDPDLTLEELAPNMSPGNAIKDIETWTTEGLGTLLDGFEPLFPSLDWNHAFRWESYVILTDNASTLETYITALSNRRVLDQTLYYEDTSIQLSRSSSLSFYAMNGHIEGPLAAFLNSGDSRVKQFPLAVAQLSYDRDFAHLNLICKQVTQAEMSSGTIAQRFSLSLDQPLLNEPQFFTNHRTGGLDIVVQDVSNKLYLIGAGGKILWTKQLPGPVMGAVGEVDILRNGKKQLVFNTANRLFVLDRLGNNVAPFPLKFRDDITQPVSVFDYDNNRKYRFLVCQGNELLMYDGQGKVVKGFKFKKTQSPVAQSPVHIRMGNKDYILVAEENGKLNILSRVGKSRIPVNKSFDFSDVPITREGNKFVVITKQNTKESIDQSGGISSVPLNVSKDYYFTTLGPNKVTLDDNLMRIDGKLVELPFGIYSRPELHRVHRTTYVSITELQENKLYLYDLQGRLLDGFPVFGNTAADLGDVDRSRKPAIVTQGGQNEVLLYKIQ